MTTCTVTDGKSSAERRASSAAKRMERLAAITPEPLEHFDIEAHDLRGGALRRSPSFSPDEDQQGSELYWLNLQAE